MVSDSGKKILVIDDNEDAAQSLSLVLGTMGYEVSLALDGPGGIAAARALRPDVVFLDLGMPGMSGYEVARHLRADATLSDTRLVALTGYGSEQDQRATREAGFDLHVVKPVLDFDALEELLRGWDGPRK
jgi:CheY-like chemotaxis protein